MGNSVPGNVSQCSITRCIGLDGESISAICSGTDVVRVVFRALITQSLNDSCQTVSDTQLGHFQTRTLTSWMMLHGTNPNQSGKDRRGLM